VTRKPRAAQLGVNPDEYNRLLAAQDGHCALCPNTPKTRRLSVDHDHKTGAVRGLLCYRCNRALPHYLPAEWFARAAEYVGRNVTDDGQPAAPVVIIDARAAEITELRATGMTLQAIADRYGISRQRVHQIIRGAS
jgi:DNA-binding CsgD family transcriptional regulator